jgi:hypothetical protein
MRLWLLGCACKIGEGQLYVAELFEGQMQWLHQLLYWWLLKHFSILSIKMRFIKMIQISFSASRISPTQFLAQPRALESA